MKWTSLLPFDKFRLLTKLPTHEIEARLKSITGDRSKKYSGIINYDKFEIMRHIEYRNSFNPLIKGSIVMHPGDTEVTITMRPHGAILAFMCFWLGVVGMICIVMIVVLITGNDKSKGFSPVSLIPFGMFFFGYGILMVGYRSESGGAKALLTDLLDAQEVAS